MARGRLLYVQDKEGSWAIRRISTVREHFGYRACWILLVGIRGDAGFCICDSAAELGSSSMVLLVLGMCTICRHTTIHSVSTPNLKCWFCVV